MPWAWESSASSTARVAGPGSVRVDDVASMIDFLTSHKLLGDKKTPKAAEVCVPLGQ